MKHSTRNRSLTFGTLNPEFTMVLVWWLHNRNGDAPHLTCFKSLLNETQNCRLRSQETSVDDVALQTLFDLPQTILSQLRLSCLRLWTAMASKKRQTKSYEVAAGFRRRGVSRVGVCTAKEGQLRGGVSD